jgi:hypothetical protein
MPREADNITHYNPGRVVQEASMDHTSPVFVKGLIPRVALHVNLKTLNMRLVCWFVGLLHLIRIRAKAQKLHVRKSDTRILTWPLGGTGPTSAR